MTRTRRTWKQWSEAEARAALSAWRKSRKPLATFAREQGYSDQRLRWWRARLDPTAGAMVPVSTTALAPVRIVVREDQPIEIAVRSGQVIRVRPGFSRELLIDVVHTLESSC